MSEQLPAYIERFNKLQQRGRWFYSVRTAISVALIILVIQWVDNRVSWKAVGLYGIVGALIAQIDWIFLARRYTTYQNSKDR